jgi:beta-glucosidase
VPPVSGSYSLRLVWSGSRSCEPPVLSVGGTEYGVSAQIGLLAGVPVPFDVRYMKSADNPGIRLEWLVPGEGRPNAFERECAAAAAAQKVVAVIGLGMEYEREGKDKDTLDLPREQMDLLERVHGDNRNLVVVLINGSPISAPWLQENAAAVVEAWYPGEQGGRALADVLYGRVNPSGRLCASFPHCTGDLPPFDRYDMEDGRTYMYCRRDPLYPFGFGLSYTTYEYSGLRCDEEYRVCVDVRNAGDMGGSEVLQFYVDSAGRSGQPRWRLVGVQRVELAAGAAGHVEYPLSERSFSLIDERGARMVYPGTYTLYAGGSQPDARSLELGASRPAVCSVTIGGEAREIPY